MASRVERGELELIEEPVAIVQAGVFAYANHAFLEFVGVPDLPELMAMCDRIGVMQRGLLQDIRYTKDWTEEQIMSQAVGA